MAQKKLLRFAEIKNFPNVLEYPKEMPGRWQQFFQNDQPITLELACGRGEYTIGLATMHPDQNIIGVDVKGNRMFIGAKAAMEKKLNNAAFLRTQIEMVNEYFAPAEVDAIWITFPDPQLRTSHAKKRLTHPRFLRLYKKFVKPGGSIFLKTDSPQLFRFTKVVIEQYGLLLVEENADVYAGPHAAELGIKTHYESLDIAGSKKIFYLHFKLTGDIPMQDDKLQDTLRETETN